MGETSLECLVSLLSNQLSRYSRLQPAQPRSWKLWRIGISLRGDFDEKRELLASGIGTLTSGSASADGKVAYRVRDSSDAIYQIPISERGRKLGPTSKSHFPWPGLIFFLLG
jgi:hypothetical protein